MAQTNIGGHVLIPYLFDWEGTPAVRVRYSFATAIADSPTGAEDRALLRPSVRRPMGFMLRGRDATDSAMIAETLRAAQAATRAAVPQWARADLITARAGNTLTLQAPCGRHAAGDTLLVADPFSGAWTAVTVASRAANVVTLTGAAPGAGAVAVPVLFGRLAGPPRESAEGGGTRTFACEFMETPRPPAVAAAWAPLLYNVYFLITVDNSGSMSAEIEAITAAVDKLRDLLRDNVYEGDEDLADEFVQIFTDEEEQWLAWLARVADAEQSTRYVCAAFVNESNAVYHGIPSVPGDEPTAAFAADYAAYALEKARCELRLGAVFSVRPSEPTYSAAYAAFQTHLANALAGTGGYGGLGDPLRTLGVSSLRSVAVGQTPSWYLAQLLTLVDLHL